jgi:hypothetical protein
MQSDKRMTLIKFRDEVEKEKALDYIANRSSFVVSAHEDPLVMDLPRYLRLSLYQLEIKFDPYHDDSCD